MREKKSIGILKMSYRPKEKRKKLLNMLFYFYSQLLHDGHHESAQLLSKVIQPVPDCPPSNRLQKVVQLGLRSEPNSKYIRDVSQTHILVLFLPSIIRSLRGEKGRARN